MRHGVLIASFLWVNGQSIGIDLFFHFYLGTSKMLLQNCSPTCKSCEVKIIGKDACAMRMSPLPHEYDELQEDVMIWVLETRIFESDQSELQSVVPTLYVVKVCGNCILNAKNSKKQFKRPISLFSLCAVESSQLKRPIFDENLRNKNTFFWMFSNSMT